MRMALSRVKIAIGPETSIHSAGRESAIVNGVANDAECARNH